jgi:hypothetical protein
LPILCSNNRAITSLSVSNVTITNAATFGLNFRNVIGSGTFTGVQISGTRQGALDNPANKYTIIRGSNNIEW